MATNYSPKIVTDGLVLSLDAADKNSYIGSGTTWTDLSANGHVGTLTNGPTFDSNNGGAIDFDGDNDYVTVPDSSTFDVLALDFTIEIVLKSQGAISAHESPLSRYNPSGVKYGTVRLV
jgi:hypothetical protein